MNDIVIYRMRGLALLSLTGGKQAPFSRLQTCLTTQPGRSALAGINELELIPPAAAGRKYKTRIIKKQMIL